ncbi:MAG: hypothetical protein OJF48_003962 [Afipia sp.]|nr:MAG: hypothetical protein OJF48_003962 [Afipia sp.]
MVSRSSSLRAKRSNPALNKQGLDCFVASAPRNDEIGSLRSLVVLAL